MSRLLCIRNNEGLCKFNWCGELIWNFFQTPKHSYFDVWGKKSFAKVTAEFFIDEISYQTQNYGHELSRGRLGIIHLVRTCAYQGVTNFSFSENFAYVLNGWFFMSLVIYSSCHNATIAIQIKDEASKIGARQSFFRSANQDVFHSFCNGSLNVNLTSPLPPPVISPKLCFQVLRIFWFFLLFTYCCKKANDLSI